MRDVYGINIYGVHMEVTNEISTKLIPREKIIEKPEVHVAGFVPRDLSIIEKDNKQVI
jgi:hypothetical protein